MIANLSKMGIYYHNNMGKIRRILPVALLILSFIFLAYLSFMRYRLGIIRFFDVDEAPYLNWAYHIKIGYRPYVDFMMIVTPLYVLLNIPLFFFWSGTDPFIMARIFAFVISLLTASSLIWLVFEMRKSWIAIVAAIIFFTLPMPGDKILEIRPDNLSIALFLLGLVFQMKWMKHFQKKWAFLAGIFYSLALLTLQKILPYVIIAGIFVFLKRMVDIKAKSFKWLIIGGMIPIFLFLGWAIFSGNPGLVLYSISKLPLEYTRVYRTLDLKFFYFQPNNVYYGENGYQIGIIANHILWLSGLVIAIIQIIYFLFLKRKNILPQLLLPCLTLSSFFLYLTSPMKFPQYLIPSAVFISLSVALCIESLWQLAKKSWRLSFLFFFSYLIAGFFLYRAFLHANFVKFFWTNKLQLQNIKTIYEMIPKSAYVLDLDGAMIYNPYPYYICCLPFESSRKDLSRSLPSLKNALIKTKTRYIYQGGYDGLNLLAPVDFDFIDKNYSREKDNTLLISKNW